MMKTVILIMICGGVCLATPSLAATTNTAWSLNMPQYNYDNVTMHDAFKKLESISQRVAPDGKGVRFLILDEHNTGRATYNMSNATIRTAANFIAENNNADIVFLEETAVVLPSHDLPHRATMLTASVLVRCEDGVTGKPITTPLEIRSALGEQCEIPITSRGTYFIPIVYPVRTMKAGDHWHYRPIETTLSKLTITASGYEPESLELPLTPWNSPHQPIHLIEFTPRRIKPANNRLQAIDAKASQPDP